MTGVVLPVLACTLVAIFAGPRVARVPGHVWGPVLGALALIGLAVIGLGPALALPGLLAALLEHLHVPVLILALAYLSISLDESGVFDWCSLQLVQLARGDGRRLLLAVFVGVSAITYVTSNDIVILAMTPILVHLGKNARIADLTPYLMAQFVAANTASMGLYIGNPTNVVIGGAAGLGFVGYAERMLLPSLVAMGCALAILWLFYVRRAPRRFVAPSRVARWTPAMTLKASLFGACLLALAALGNPWTVNALLETPSPTAVRRGVALIIVVIAVGFALVALAYDLARDRRRQDAGLRRRLGRMPVEIVPFFLGFVVLLRGLEEAGLSRRVAQLVEAAFRLGPIPGSIATGLGGVLTVNVLNNIPSTLFFESLWLGGLEARLDAVHPAAADIFVDASLVASNVGANLTFIGALAGLMWLRILRDSTRDDPGAPRVPNLREFVWHGLLSVPLVTTVTCIAIAVRRLALA